MRASDILEAAGGVVRVGDHPSLRNSWHRLRKRGDVVPAFPGVVMLTGLVDDVGAWLKALHLWNPNAVVAGTAAAMLLGTPDVEVTDAVVHVSDVPKQTGPLRFTKRALPAELVHRAHEHTCTNAAATVITAVVHDGDWDTATKLLRLGRVTVEEIQRAVSRWGDRVPSDVREVGLDLSGNPWSPAEVDAHRLMRRANIRGWVGNRPVWINGVKYVPDMSIPEARLALEVNSHKHHSSPTALEYDSSRMNQFLSVGWRMYAITPAQVRDHPDDTIEFLRSITWKRHRGKLA